MALPSNIFWAGAINPGNMAAHIAKSVPLDIGGGVSERKESEDPAAARQGIVDYTGVRAASDTADFVVREMPLALQVWVCCLGSLTNHDHRLTPAPQLLVLDYDTLSPEQEREFLAALHRGNGVKSVAVDSSVDPRAFELRLIETILFCQAFVRRQDIWRVHVSIRDITRALTLYRTLLQVLVCGVWVLDHSY